MLCREITAICCNNNKERMGQYESKMLGFSVKLGGIYVDRS